MANGSYEGKDVHHPEIRAMFTREALLASDWYRERLETKQARDIELWKRHVAYLDTFSNRISHQDMVSRLDIRAKVVRARQRLSEVSDPSYLAQLHGTIGADPARPARKA